MRRTIKLFSMAAMAALALSAFVASAAQAGHTWEVGGALMGAGTSKTCQATADGTMTLKSEVLGEEFDITSTATATDGCRIIQSGSGSTAVAEDTAEKITFSGLTVDKPVGCSAASPITTVAMSSKIITVGSVAYTTFKPESGTTWFSLVLSGCAAAETYPMKGSLCLEMPQVGVFAVQQTIKASAAADTACSTDGLSFGGKPVILRGGVILELTGVDAGKSWGFTTT
jgi:hypothetical protein